MSFYNEQMNIALDAAVDLSANYYGAVKLSAAGKINVASLNTSRSFIGILQTDPTSGQRATVCVRGVSKAVAGASVSAGDIVTHDSSGHIITKPASGTYVCFGMALEAAGAANDVIAILVRDPVELTG